MALEASGAMKYGRTKANLTKPEIDQTIKIPRSQERRAIPILWQNLLPEVKPHERRGRHRQSMWSTAG